MTIGRTFAGERKAGWFRTGWWFAAVAALAAGCGQQPPKPPPAPAPIPPAVLTLHWLGKERLAGETNAAYQMAIWKMPESERLETQTLDKLARALPALLGATATNAAADAAPLLRPLLDDLVQRELFLEVRAATNIARELSFAVRLPSDRAELWRSNFTAFAERLTGAPVAAAIAPEPGWLAQRSQPALSLHYTRAGDWTLAGFGVPNSPVFADFARRFGTNAPSPALSHGTWLELEADLAHFLRTCFVAPPPPLPALRLSVTGDGQNVRTRGELTFAKPLALELVPWTVPTNLIHDPLISFTALRGVQGWLESSHLWQRLVGGPAPREHYFWGVRSLLFETYAAAVWPGSSNTFSQATRKLMDEMNAAITNDWNEVTPMSGTNGIIWACDPFMKAYLRHEVGPLGEIASGGFYTVPAKGRPIPEDLLNQFLPRTNLLYYDWEITEARVFTWIQVTSFLRMVFKKAQLSEDTVGLKWLLAAMPKLGNAGTTIHLVDPNRLAFSRSSSIGFTGAELQLLMDWLESPNFPHGLNTFDTPVNARRRRSSTLGPDGQAIPPPPVSATNAHPGR